MWELAFKHLRKFWKSCWLDADDVSTGMIPIESYMPDTFIESLINSLPTLYTLPVLQSLVHDGEIDCGEARTTFAPFTAQNSYVANRSHELTQILIDLHHDFDKIRERNRDEAKAKRALKAESRRAQVQVEDEDGELSDLVSEDEPDRRQTSGIKLRIDLR
jgi:hypothetical protein